MKLLLLKHVPAAKRASLVLFAGVKQHIGILSPRQSKHEPAAAAAAVVAATAAASHHIRTSEDHQPPPAERGVAKWACQTVALEKTWKHPDQSVSRYMPLPFWLWDLHISGMHLKPNCSKYFLCQLQQSNQSHPLWHIGCVYTSKSEDSNLILC